MESPITAGWFSPFLLSSLLFLLYLGKTFLYLFEILVLLVLLDLIILILIFIPGKCLYWWFLVVTWWLVSKKYLELLDITSNTFEGEINLLTSDVIFNVNILGRTKGALLYGSVWILLFLLNILVLDASWKTFCFSAFWVWIIEFLILLFSWRYVIS